MPKQIVEKGEIGESISISDKEFEEMEEENAEQQYEQIGFNPTSNYTVNEKDNDSLWVADGNNLVTTLKSSNISILYTYANQYDCTSCPDALKLITGLKEWIETENKFNVTFLGLQAEHNVQTVKAFGVSDPYFNFLDRRISWHPNLLRFQASHWIRRST